MALQAVDLGANKEEEEALYKTVMVTAAANGVHLLASTSKRGRTEREGTREETDERAEHFVDSLARRGTQVLDRRASVCLPQFGEAKGNFFVAFVALATVLFLFCCPAIP